MIRRLYIHNFRCLENFELDFKGQSSLLLIGKNGSGKSSVRQALEVLQRIARGKTRVTELVRPTDFGPNLSDKNLMRLEVEAELGSKTFEYTIAFLSSKMTGASTVYEEKLEVEGKPIFARGSTTKSQNAAFIDLLLVALPIVQISTSHDSISMFKEWLARLVILQPIPSLIKGDSQQSTLEPTWQMTNLGEWFTGIIAQAPSAYAEMDKYLKQVMPDFTAITNPLVGKDDRSLSVQFSKEREIIQIPFEHLSDGEKCFIICALVLAANHAYGPIFCFWDEPDNYIALSEVGHFVAALRQAFHEKGQILMTSHNPEAIQGFSNENTILLYRNSHLEPTRTRYLSEVEINGDLVGALIRDDVHP